MYKRLKTIHKYYSNLEYNRITKEEALKNISTLTKKVQLKNIDLFNRFSFVATLMKDNLSIFQSACEHVDTVADIIQVLNGFDAQLLYFRGRRIYTDDILFKVCFYPLITLIYTVWKECEVQLFFEDIILKDSILDNNALRKEILGFKIIVNKGCNEMILLHDSDLYAVISYLMITRQFSLNKIWVQEQIQEKFLSLLKKNFPRLDFPIHVFRFKEDLLTAINKNNLDVNITSLWSENIIAAKNLAFSLHKEIIYINTHMNIYSARDSPQSQLFDKATRDVFLWNIHFEKIFEPKQSESIFNAEIHPIYNLFYRGTWMSNPGMYVIRKGAAWAYISFNDVKQCINSANIGFEIWSAMSYDSRFQILSNFALALECNGKFLLANVISKLIKDAYLCKHNLACYEMGRVEVTIQQKPTGIIFLKEENEITLFVRLTKSLIAGNSVIVLCDASSCNLTSYCNMFASAEIPPGVISMLPSESVEDLETFLFNTTYARYISSFFVKNRAATLADVILRDLNILKQIIVAIE